MRRGRGNFWDETSARLAEAWAQAQSQHDGRKESTSTLAEELTRRARRRTDSFKSQTDLMGTREHISLVDRGEMLAPSSWGLSDHNIQLQVDGGEHLHHPHLNPHASIRNPLPKHSPPRTAYRALRTPCNCEGVRTCVPQQLEGFNRQTMPDNQPRLLSFHLSLIWKKKLYRWAISRILFPNHSKSSGRRSAPSRPSTTEASSPFAFVFWA